MPSKEKHLEIVLQNFNALSCLVTSDPTEHICWNTTIIYYMALHYIHAYLAEKNNEHPSAHVSLQKKIAVDTSLKALYDKYRMLEDESRNARYEGHQLSIYILRSGVLKNFSDIQKKIGPLLAIPNNYLPDLYPFFPNR